MKCKSRGIEKETSRTYWALMKNLNQWKIIQINKNNYIKLIIIKKYQNYIETPHNTPRNIQNQLSFHWIPNDCAVTATSPHWCRYVNSQLAVTTSCGTSRTPHSPCFMSYEYRPLGESLFCLRLPGFKLLISVTNQKGIFNPKKKSSRSDDGSSEAIKI